MKFAETGIPAVGVESFIEILNSITGSPYHWLDRAREKNKDLDMQINKYIERRDKMREEEEECKDRRTILNASHFTRIHQYWYYLFPITQ